MRGQDVLHYSMYHLTYPKYCQHQVLDLEYVGVLFLSNYVTYVSYFGTTQHKNIKYAHCATNIATVTRYYSCKLLFNYNISTNNNHMLFGLQTFLHLPLRLS